MTERIGRYQAMYEVVTMIPSGCVATYGQIAALAGFPGCARQVGYALSALPEGSSVPWQRVVNAQGRVSLRSGKDGYDLYQRLKLEEECVEFDQHGRIPLDRFLWKPDVTVVCTRKR